MKKTKGIQKTVKIVKAVRDIIKVSNWTAVQLDTFI